jgi:hypothetical protein
MTFPLAETGNRSLRGFVLPLLLILLLALTLLGHGVLLLARRELQASKAFLHAARADLAAAGALAEGLGRLPPPGRNGTPNRRVPLFSGWREDGLWLDAAIRWLDSEMFFLEGRGRSRGWPGVRARGAIGWRLDPETRLRSLGGGVELNGSLVQGEGVEASSSGILDPPTGWSARDCSAFASSMETLYSGRVLPLTAPLPAFDSLQEGPGAGIPGIGLLSGSELLARARIFGSLPPEESGGGPVYGCPDGGAPMFMGVESDFVVRDARICGTLVVGGDLVLEGRGGCRGWRW